MRWVQANYSWWPIRCTLRFLIRLDKLQEIVSMVRESKILFFFHSFWQRNSTKQINNLCLWVHILLYLHCIHVFYISHDAFYPPVRWVTKTHHQPALLPRPPLSTVEWLWPMRYIRLTMNKGLLVEILRLPCLSLNCSQLESIAPCMAGAAYWCLNLWVKECPL